MATLAGDFPNTQHGGDRGRRIVRDIRGYIVRLAPAWAAAAKQTSKKIRRLGNSFEIKSEYSSEPTELVYLVGNSVDWPLICPSVG